ncbi:DNA gyrase/topoisomerase IV subunit A [Nocardioides bruguierae]|uniref:DNA gyrase/topoisomerase IV subunit A n=1 Tax=Nocardioides bruguierae TaxID=2945102 RepID=UPI0020209EF4|nr:DNA topoisomerase IV subunit A [Nocardioides bruguierae]MCL8024330.1 DNA topoisomerase IV subunit A [Nocardioides bruguierae]
MAARSTTTPPPEDDFEEHILDIDVGDEMRSSFLEYAYSVIYSRALPDARDGLKPVQRRILYTMHDNRLLPDRGHVKSARVVGDVMGRLHPHGDGAIYDALVRMAQPWVMRLPYVDGHGNFGSPDDSPAAMRYTECRMASPAVAMTASIDEDTVDFRPNYDSRELEPAVLPAAIPNLLVNGSAGIAVGMATNCAPHNLVEVVQALRHLITNPGASLDDLMRFVPGPDLPTGGKIVGLDGIRDAYESGRGSFKMRATTRVEQVGRRKAIVITELPYGVGTEKLFERIKTLVQNKKLQGIADLKDLTDRANGLRLVIEIKNGFVPEAVLEQLFRSTPLEDSFGINAVALVDGQPRTLGLKEMLEVFLEHRYEVVRRRSAFRRGKKADRLHLVEGLLVALLDIDEVIAVIRSSDDTGAARQRLMTVFDLSQLQADYILEMQLRRLTRFSRLELEKESEELRREIEELDAILNDAGLLRSVVSDELADVAAEHGTPRRTVLLESAGAPAKASATPLEIADDPCVAYLSSAGLVARSTAGDLPGRGDGRAGHDVVVSAVRTTARADVGVVTDAGRLVRLSVLDLPTLPPSANDPNLQGGMPLEQLLVLEKNEKALALVPITEEGPGLALGTRHGVVKRVKPEVPKRGDEWEVVTLDGKDRVVGVVQLTTGSEELCFVTSDAQLLHFSADAVRPQGRAGGGVAGVKLAAGQQVVSFGAFDPDAGEGAVVVTIAGSGDSLPGTGSGTVKVSSFGEYPAKGRATGGVRCHRFLKGEDRLQLAWVGPGPARAAADSGAPVELPAPTGRRDGSGVPLAQTVVAVASRVADALGLPGTAEEQDGDQDGAADAGDTEG